MVERRCQGNFWGARISLDPIFHPAAADAVFRFSIAAARR